ncbi:hypothetical protein COY07_00855 [Candidatus Peregrinibacteria bacterium CG_4_10_14_0_2_um_filter_43_11]|nr:MAG: hypothetical protein COY07_00855 [Candidatus Peregrinibacteria bacterium CG_4_10_14_0_2_um_filter_43_11]
MSTFKIVLVSLAVALALPFIAFAAEPTPTTGTVVIQVMDQDSKPIGGYWFFRQGGEQGAIVRNGTTGETFQREWGIYYLQGQNKKGYESFELTNANPQEVVVGETTTYTLVYYKDGYAAAQVAAAEAAAQTEAATPVVTPAVVQPEPVVVKPITQPGITGDPADSVAPVTAEPVVVEKPAAPVAEPVTIQEPESLSLISDLLSDLSKPVETTPAVAETVTEAQPVKLAVTGPEGILGALMVLSGLGSLTVVRRRK